MTERYYLQFNPGDGCHELWERMETGHARRAAFYDGDEKSSPLAEMVLAFLSAIAEVGQTQQAGEAVTSLANQYGQVGTILDVTPITDLLLYYPHLQPEHAWIVRYSVTAPHERTDIFVVGQREDRYTIDSQLGYDPIAMQEKGYGHG